MKFFHQMPGMRFIIFFLIWANNCSLAQEQKSDTITISIVHGFRVKKAYQKAYRALPGGGWQKSIGGLKGGHVEVHLDTLVYGFTDRPQAKIPHLFTHNKKRNNGLFTKISLQDWQKRNQTASVTLIKIPISKEQYLNLQQNYESNLQNAPYDFALFGMRCASSAYDMLAQVEILPRRSRRKTVMGIFHPRAFRKFIIPWAKDRGYFIETRQGVDEKEWDKE